jgi:RND family efflux transporter MFP subunit
LRATVREVAAAADPSTRTFLIRADLMAPLQQLGQTATVLIDLPRLEGITLLPLSAVRESQGRSAVWVVDPARQVVQSRPVDVAGAEGNEVVVKAGVKPGDLVVTAGVHVLTEGQRVRLAAGVTGPAAASAASAPGAAAPAASR